MTYNSRVRSSLQIMRAYSNYQLAVWLLLLIAGLCGLSLFISGFTKPFESSELAFTDRSPAGLSIVPASCPSNPHYAGECGVDGSGPGPAGSGSPGSTPPSVSSGNACVIGLSPSTVVVGGSAVLSWSSNYQIFGIPFPVAGTISPSPGAVAASGVTTVAPPGSVNYTGTFTPTGSLNGIPQNWLTPVTCSSLLTVLPGTPGVAQCAQQNFCVGQDIYQQSTSCTNTFIQRCPYGCANGVCLGPQPPVGFIRVRPSLLRTGDSTIVEWSASNVSSCVVAENNPLINDSWTGADGVQASSPISGQTVYTLSCAGLDGSTLGRSATVNITPTFDEQ